MNSGSDLLTDLFRAYYDARRHKRNTRSQLAFEIDSEHNLITLYEQIRDRTYRPSPGICFITDKPVKREIFASPFRDRVVHHLLFNYLAPIFERRMIYDSYSCRKGKGTSAGIERIEHHIRSCSDNYTRQAYVLKLDLRGYFMSIDKRLLYDIISRTVVGVRNVGFDRDLVDFLLRSILLRDPLQDCSIVGRKSDWIGLPPSKSLFESPPGVGLPIGDLTSQLFSNIYMNELDQYAKRRLKCRHYGRYVDDFYIVHRSRNYLKTLIPDIRDFLEKRLMLELHPDKIELRHHTQGIRFLGAYVKPYRRYPSARTTASFRHVMTRIEEECRKHEPSSKRLTRMLSQINSYCGYLGHFRSYRILNRQFVASPLTKFFRFALDYKKSKLKGEYKPSSHFDSAYGCVLFAKSIEQLLKNGTRYETATNHSSFGGRPPQVCDP